MTNPLFPDMDLPRKKEKKPETGFLDFPATYENLSTPDSGQVNGPMFERQCPIHASNGPVDCEYCTKIEELHHE